MIVVSDPFAPEIARHWTDLIGRALPLVQPGERVCAYDPWIAALRQVEGLAPVAGQKQSFEERSTDRYPDLMRFAEQTSRPGWPRAQAHLVEFALTFLEADVKLFRSGYAKTRLLTRLKQTDLTEAQVARVDTMLRRAVTQGAGLEEFRAYCCLAGHLMAQGRLPELPKWLKDQADGVVLTSDRAGGKLWYDMQRNPKLSREDRKKLMQSGYPQRSQWGIVWPAFDSVVPAGDLQREPARRVRRNAFQMYYGLQLRQPGKW